MPVELKVPAVGESITEVQIGEWMKSPGDAARADEPVVVIETDKVTVELPAPVSGRITKVLKQRGEQAKVGEVIGFMEEGAGEAAPAAAPKAAAPKSAAAASGTPANSGSPPSAATATKPTSKATPSAAAPAKAADAPTRAGATRVMPAAARALADAGLAADEVTPSGPGGRLLKEDVQRAAQSTPSAPAPKASATRAEDSSADGREEEVVPMTPLRKRIAQRLVEAQQTAAILTTFNEIDMTAVMALRKQHQERFLERYQVKLGFMSFFVKASIEALKKIPNVNAEVRGDSIVYRNYYDIGIAVGGGKGLVVPIIRSAERLSFAQVEVKVGELGARAKDNKLTLEELTGGTFTISNGGIYGSLMSTPILNPPQSGILGLHAIQDRPVAINGQVVIRPMMYVALSYDHRVVDGREAVTFLRTIKECVEEPSRILLEI